MPVTCYCSEDYSLLTRELSLKLNSGAKHLEIGASREVVTVTRIDRLLQVVRNLLWHYRFSFKHVFDQHGKSLVYVVKFVLHRD